MSKITFSNDTFNCHLRCGQCEFIKDNGQQCRNRVCIGSPLCWIHNRRQYDVQVKPSTIEEAGKGLFTLVGRRIYDWICPYNGEALDDDCMEQRYPEGVTAPYAVDDGDGCALDSACVRGIGSMPNGLFTPTGRPRSRATHNAYLAYRGDDIWVRARKNIQADEELFVHYGDNYRLQDDHTTKRRRVPDSRPC